MEESQHGSRCQSKFTDHTLDYNDKLLQMRYQADDYTSSPLDN